MTGGLITHLSAGPPWRSKVPLTKMPDRAGMTKYGLILLTLALAACDTGTPAYWSLAPQRVEAQGMAFDVRVNGLTAEASRQNVAFPPPRRESVAKAAAVAVHKVTGCDPVQTRGDSSIVEARLSCDGQTAPRWPKSRKLYFCQIDTFLKNPDDLGDYHVICR